MMLGLVFSFLGFFPWLVLQLGRLLVLLQAKVLVALRPAQWVVGPLSCIGRAHTILTVRLLRPLGNESAVQTVTRLLKGLDWAAASEAAAAQHQLTGGIMAIAKGRRPKHSKAALRRRGQLAAWTQRGVVGPVSGFRVTHAHEHGVVKAWYLTPHVKWVDVVELTLLPTPGGHVFIEAHSRSASVVPALIPFASLWALLLWWFPFDDLSTNYNHLGDIRRHLRERYGLHVEQTVVHRGSGFGSLFKGPTLRLFQVLGLE